MTSEKDSAKTSVLVGILLYDFPIFLLIPLFKHLWSFCQLNFACEHDGNGNYMIAINLNCLEDLDTESLIIKKVDGKSL